MKLPKFIIAIILLSSLSYANFLTLSDICDTTPQEECPNDETAIKEVQKALNKGLSKKITEDGKWGKETKSAVIALQKKHNINPSVGYVGSITKRKLEELYATNPQAKKNPRVCGTGTFLSFDDFARSVNLKKSYRVYTDKKLLKKAKKHNTKLVVDVSEQRVKLLVNNKVALCSPCTTGAKHKFEPNTKIYRDKHTPTGNYRIMEKIKDKRSNIFGNITRKGKRIYHGDRRKYRGSWKGVKYRGASLENWMRITGGGIGLHASKYVKRYPGTNGCIRLPKSVSKTIFKHVHKGTPVKVKN